MFFSWLGFLRITVHIRCSFTYLHWPIKLQGLAHTNKTLQRLPAETWQRYRLRNLPSCRVRTCAHGCSLSSAQVLIYFQMTVGTQSGVSDIG